MSRVASTQASKEKSTPNPNGMGLLGSIASFRSLTTEKPSQQGSGANPAEINSGQPGTVVCPTFQQGPSADLAGITRGQERIMIESNTNKRSTALSGGLDQSPSGGRSNAFSFEGATEWPSR